MADSNPGGSPPKQSASPAKSMRSRVGSVLRRSSVLNAMRPPSPFRSQSSRSLKADAAAQDAAKRPRSGSASEAGSRDPTPLTPPAQPHVGPSPLAKEAMPTPQPSPAPPQLPLQPEPEPLATTSSPLVPPPERAPVSAPTSTEPVAPVAETEAPSKPDLEPINPQPVVESSPADVLVASPETIHQEAPASIASLPQQQSTPEIKPTTLPERRADTFAWGDDLPSLTKKPSTSSIPPREPTPEPQPLVQGAHTESPRPAEAPLAPETSSFEEVANASTLSPKRSSSSLAQEPLAASPQSTPPDLSRKGSKSSLASSYGQVLISAPGRRVSVSVDPSLSHLHDSRRGRSRGSSVRVSIDDNNLDPFADPPGTILPTRHVLSPIMSAVEPPPSAAGLPSSFPFGRRVETPEVSPSPAPMSLPEPMHVDPPAAAVVERSVQAEPESEVSSYRQETPTPIVMPLPPAMTLMSGSRGIREMPSGYSLGAESTGQTIHDTDERLPLLPRNAEPSTSKSPAPPPNGSNVSIGFPVPQRAWPVSGEPRNIGGWIEYILPDSTFYYYHAEYRVTTDADLRVPKKLEAVTDFLDRKNPPEVSAAAPGWEVWLRDNGKTRFDFVPARNWVNHQAKVLTFDAPPHSSDELLNVSDDDRLDMEYRYWAYLEAHPAHAPLPSNAHTEALDALTWSYTDCILPSQQHASPPFAPQECQELMNLLKSFEKEAQAGSTLVHTRVVARVLLRVVEWRQHYFRPNRALPHDASKKPLRTERRMPFRRFFLDIIMGLFCLGIPYLFMDRTQHHRLDEESGLRSSGPVLMIGGCACLVAAVILSASVTFLTLPGLDDMARLAGLIAILFSASSMVSSVVALFRYKADVERTVVYVGGEGLMVMSRRSIVMSLPLVFLAWGIAAFITGITLYSFRGATLTSREVIRQPFVDHTPWVTVGTMGGLAGVMLMTALLARR